ncbi:MAG: hypothetical protein RL456_301 [Pseudomonadota bacterium]|jgi:diguanylate cyclase (GGDEF)-like protein/PAS domain S-box-containing protein
MTLNLLYVEDSDLDADLTRRHLRRHAPDIRMDVAPGLAEARARLLGAAGADAAPPCDMLLVDMHLPDGNGLDLVVQLRRAGRDLPVIVLTGQGDERAAVAALRSGADDYVIKDGDYLERLPALLEAVRSRHARRRHPPGRVMHVLYAERSSSDIDLLRRHLRHHEPHIILDTVGTAAEVLQALDTGRSPDGLGPADVLLLDYLLPGMNALELVREIRERRGLDIPIVVITGQGDEEAAAEAIRLGAHDYLVKHEHAIHRLPIALESALLRVQLERERQALMESETRFRQLADTLDDVVWLADGRTRRLLYISPAVERVWGFRIPELLDDPERWIEAVHPDDRVRLLATLHADTGTGTTEADFRLRRADGELRDVRLRSYAARDEQGRTVRRAGVAQDITEQRRQEARIQHLAFHDALTGLPNRALVLDRLERGLAQAARHGGRLAVLFLDLDRFKNINDTLGHLAGDELLRGVAQRLREALPPERTVARLGGDEFLVLIEDLDDPAQAAHAADDLMASLDQPFDILGQELHVTASLGVSLYPRDGPDVQSLLKFADTALYKAKAAGRNTYRFFSQEMDAQAHARLRLENDLRRALERAELRLHYQPLFLCDGTLRGAEALVRWHHPQRGIVPPAEFIPVAEDTGMIHVIGDWVLDEACRQARRWHDRGHAGLRVSVNLSARQLERSGLDLTVRSALRRSGLDPRMLELEITESSVMEDPARALDLLHALRAVGVGLSVDDFGTGYSSLAYLKRFPLDGLKIDRSFVDGIPDDGDDMAIVEAIVAMARKLKLRIVAEGVETPAQRAVLQRLGCDELQGYLLGHPVSAADMTALLRRQPPGPPLSPGA